MTGPGRREVRAAEPAADPPPASSGEGGASRLRRRDQRLAWWLIGPAVVVVLLLVFVPVLWNVALSLRELRLIELRDFNPLVLELSLENYAEVLGDDDFLELLRTTLLYAVLGTSLSILLGLWAALTVRAAFRGRALVRGLILFPYVVPVVAAAYLWRTMLNPQVGIVTAWLDTLFGIGNLNVVTQQSVDVTVLGTTLGIPAAFTMIVLFEGWRNFPFAFLFFLAALQALPGELEEAAHVDGANAVQRFRHVVLPQLRGVFAVLFLLRFLWTFNAFDEVFLLTGGAGGTTVVSVQIFEYLFGSSDVGAASALSIVLAVVLVVLLLVYFRLVKPEAAS